MGNYLMLKFLNRSKASTRGGAQCPAPLPQPTALTSCRKDSRDHRLVENYCPRVTKLLMLHQSRPWENSSHFSPELEKITTFGSLAATVGKHCKGAVKLARKNVYTPLSLFH